MKIARAILLFTVLIVSSGICAAQNIAVKAGTTKLLYDQRYYPAIYGEGVAPIIPTVGLKIGWRDFSDSPYAFICNHPEWGIAFQMDGLGDAEAIDGPGLGNIYCLYGYFDRLLLQTSRFSLGYSAGFGLGCCFSKLYDPASNPKNLLLSVPVNSRIRFGLEAQYRFSKRGFTGLGFYFNHSSNGDVNYPNRGYNGYELSLLLGLKEPESERLLPERRDDCFKRHFQFDIQASAGVVSNEDYFYYCEETLGGGDNMHYPKFAFRADCLYKYCLTHATGLGFDLSVTPFCEQIEEYDGRDDIYDPVSVGLSIIHELCYRDLTLTVGVGRYLHHNDGIARWQKVYQIVHFRYHFPDLADTFVGLTLKAHKFMNAESVQLCIGKRF